MKRIHPGPSPLLTLSLVLCVVGQAQIVGQDGIIGTGVRATDGNTNFGAVVLEPEDLPQTETLPSPWEEEAQPRSGALQFRQQTDDFGTFNVQASPDLASPALNIGQLYSGSGWLKNFETRLESNQFETLLAAGATISLLEGPYRVLATRMLGGYSLGHTDYTEDSAHGTVDLFAAQPVAGGCHWIKYGWFLDQDKDFGKTGPELGLLLFSQSCHPLTVDLAYGIGHGQDKRVGSLFNVGADDDLQIRMGTVLDGGIQVGGTAQYLKWDGPAFEEVWEAGGYLGFPLGSQARFQMDLTTGENGFRGFANLIWIPTVGCCPTNTCCASRNDATDCRVVRVQNDCLCPPTWAFSPVNRSIVVRQRRVDDPSCPFLIRCNLAIITDNGATNLDPGDSASYGANIVNTCDRPITVTQFSVQQADGTTIDFVGNQVVQPGQIFGTGGLALTVSNPVPPGVSTWTVDGVTRTFSCAFQLGDADGTVRTAVPQ